MTAGVWRGTACDVTPLLSRCLSQHDHRHPISCALFPALPSSIPGAGRLTDPTADDDDPSNSNSTDDKLDSSGMAVVAVAAGSAPVWQAGRTRCKGQVLAVGHALAHPGFRKSSSWCVFACVSLLVLVLVFDGVPQTDPVPPDPIHPIVTGRTACP